jgi:hypothetical protein
MQSALAASNYANKFKENGHYDFPSRATPHLEKFMTPILKKDLNKGSNAALGTLMPTHKQAQASSNDIIGKIKRSQSGKKNITNFASPDRR